MSSPLRFRVVEAGALISECVTRLPFRFGIVTMRAAPLCTVRVRIEHAGGSAEGFSSDLLVPKWFEKIPEQSLADCWERLVEGVRLSCDAAPDLAMGTAFEHNTRVLHARGEGFAGPRSGRLLLHQGPAMIERALIDAVCRGSGLAFHEAMRNDLTGCPDAPMVFAREPLSRVHVRHTVGLVDPLDDADDRPEIDDGLPVTLVEAIQRYGLTHFKIKVSGDVEADHERLARISEVIERECATEALCTLDGNEQFTSIEDVRRLLDRLGSDARVAPLLERIAYLEQPLSRDLTFDRDANAGIEKLSETMPVIIDEADADDDAFADAIGLGYRGVSFKNCKGVFRAIANAKRCMDSRGRLFQSGEDLTNLPIVALQQDLAVASSLGLGHIERNGHHYFAGLEHLPDRERHEALQRHPELYESSGDKAHLRIIDGMIDLASIHRGGGFGYAGPVDLESRIRIEQWTPARLASYTGD